MQYKFRIQKQLIAIGAIGAIFNVPNHLYLFQTLCMCVSVFAVKLLIGWLESKLLKIVLNQMFTVKINLV